LMRGGVSSMRRGVSLMRGGVSSMRRGKPLMRGGESSTRPGAAGLIQDVQRSARAVTIGEWQRLGDRGGGAHSSGSGYCSASPLPERGGGA
jgi:hypothetical protein